MPRQAYTRGELLAAFRQAEMDIRDLPESGPFGASDREKMTAYVAIAECANYLGIDNDEFRNAEFRNPDYAPDGYKN